ncbi:MAG: pyridoxamine 5'-phosphate oxidase [Bacteroidales bacterium]
MDLNDFREEYNKAVLDTDRLPENPLTLFHQWLEEAIQSGQPEPNAMTLATVTQDNRPAARVVLLKEVAGDHFIFYTNYESQKGRELAANPHAALVFLWLDMQRQVRVSGPAEKVSTDKSDAYFAARPEESQIGALASPQSQTIDSRESLEKKFAALKTQIQEKTIERPKHWGGYQVKVEQIEFWQGRQNRLHDRFLYTKEGNHWYRQRLAP